jgi:hypothetical protein
MESDLVAPSTMESDALAEEEVLVLKSELNQSLLGQHIDPDARSNLLKWVHYAPYTIQLIVIHFDVLKNEVVLN